MSYTLENRRHSLIGQEEDYPPSPTMPLPSLPYPYNVNTSSSLILPSTDLKFTSSTTNSLRKLQFEKGQE